MAEFLFRVWVHPADPPDIEIWHHDFEPTESGRRSVAEWAKESLSYVDLHDQFDLDESSHWQVIGKAQIDSWFDLYDDYDEELIILEFKKQQVPEEWFIEDNGVGL